MSSWCLGKEILEFYYRNVLIICKIKQLPHLSIKAACLTGLLWWHTYFWWAHEIYLKGIEEQCQASGEKHLPDFSFKKVHSLNFSLTSSSRYLFVFWSMNWKAVTMKRLWWRFVGRSLTLRIDTLGSKGLAQLQKQVDKNESKEIKKNKTKNKQVHRLKFTLHKPSQVHFLQCEGKPDSNWPEVLLLGQET